MCVSVSSRGQAGSAEREGVVASEVVRGGASACCSLSTLEPSHGVSWGSLGLQAAPGREISAGSRGC